MNTQVTHYVSSSDGPVVIADLSHKRAKAARDKLVRDGATHRQPEIDALTGHIERLDAEYAAKVAGEALAPIGHNSGELPAELETAITAASWPAIKADLDDNLMEARNWLDGALIENQDQADAVARLKDALRDGAALADQARIAEKKPHDDVIAEIQERFNAYIAPATNKKPGSVTKTLAALNTALTAWLKKLDDELKVEAKRKQDIADAELAAATQQMRDAMASSDIEAREEAEEIFADAKALVKDATAAAGAKAQAHGGGKAIGLRDFWVTSIADPVQALRWAWTNYPDRMKEVALELAKAEVRAGKRTIVGFDITNERKV